ncbi:MAG: hypothetical protein ONB25_08855 [candidate division KSB1 bacterium]|nr:hypothetical protein [candidate division KSB1 bacterium]
MGADSRQPIVSPGRLRLSWVVFSFALFVAVLPCTSHGQARVALDWKLHDVGQVRQFVSNIGSLWPTWVLWGSWSGLIYCEFPPGSHEEHVGEGGIWVGAIVGGDTAVSVTTSWHSDVEFFPSQARWDTVWVVEKGDTVDIPYWRGYTAVGDQDFVCRYADFHLTNIALHTPLYVDVIQASYAWASPPLDEMIVFNYRVTATAKPLQNVWIAYWLDGNVGYRGEGWGFALDDYSVYYPDRHLGVSIDATGGTDGNAYSPIGVKIYPPEGMAKLRWTFNWIQNPDFGPPARDPERYAEMAAGIIMQNQLDPIGSQFFIAFGPFSLGVGDTVQFYVGELLGKGLNGLLKNADRMDWLVANEFKVPSPPPRPPLRVETRSHQVVLRWKALAGDTDPETYQDPYRADSCPQPFEGYRVYKSTVGPTGPWTLLAEYDVPGNQFGANTGLAYEYTDLGLLNNLEYYYSVTAYSKPDTVSGFPSQESSVTANVKVVVPGTEPPASVGQVAVVPNPYRGDIAYDSYNPRWERPKGTRERWMEQDRRIQFINLPEACEITVYTLAGDQVTTIAHNDPYKGYEDWNLTSAVGQAVSSGIYLFTVKDTRTGAVQVGKFVIIK